MRSVRRLKNYLLATIGVSLLIPAASFAQEHSTFSGSGESLGRETSGINPEYSFPSPAGPTASSHAPASSPAAALPAATYQDPGYDREVSWRKLPMNILHDQKDLWLFPLQLAKGRHLLPAALIVGGTAAFIGTDPQVMPHFRQTTNFHDFNRIFSTSSTGAAIVIVPAVFYGVSLIRKDSYGQSTALFAGEAVVDDVVLMTVTKAITRRQRPTELPVTGPYNDTFFHSSGSVFGKGTSFPSGHAMMAFSVATIFARRYHEHRWVPFVAYAAASAIAFSRITTGAHFPADAFFGASMGYVIARYDVLRGQ